MPKFIFRQMRMTSCFCLATASGVMAYVSLVEVFGEAKNNFTDYFNDSTKGLLFATMSFFIGWLLGLIMDFLLHKFMSTDAPELSSQKDEERQPINLGTEEEMAQYKFESDTFRLII